MIRFINIEEPKSCNSYLQDCIAANVAEDIFPNNIRRTSLLSACYYTYIEYIFIIISLDVIYHFEGRFREKGHFWIVQLAVALQMLDDLGLSCRVVWDGENHSRLRGFFLTLAYHCLLGDNPNDVIIMFWKIISWLVPPVAGEPISLSQEWLAYLHYLLEEAQGSKLCCMTMDVLIQKLDPIEKFN
ncbi:hypothetical protein ACJX0J_034821 [Zea mays]